MPCTMSGHGMPCPYKARTCKGEPACSPNNRVLVILSNAKNLSNNQWQTHRSVPTNRAHVGANRRVRPTTAVGNLELPPLRSSLFAKEGQFFYACSIASKMYGRIAPAQQPRNKK